MGETENVRDLVQKIRAGRKVHETQQSIGAWQVETFGRFNDNVAAFDRSDEEWWELVDAVASGDINEIGREMADVMIVLMGWADQLGIDLQAEIDAKMQINRSRRWATNGDGTGQHIKEE